MTKHYSFLSFLLAAFLFITTGVCNAESTIIDNRDGTYSMENGIFLRQYDGYSEESQQFLSILDACYSMIGSYSEIIDPYINGEKSFEDDQWKVIETKSGICRDLPVHGSCRMKFRRIFPVTDMIFFIPHITC